jgi:hypothetical protein
MLQRDGLYNGNVRPVVVRWLRRGCPMDTRADMQNEQTSGDTTQVRSDRSVPASENGSSANGAGELASSPSTPKLHRAFTPSTFKLDETPEERDQRIRETRAMLKSLLAKTPAEVQEQQETWKILRAALNEGRPSYAKLFSDDD